MSAHHPHRARSDRNHRLFPRPTPPPGARRLHRPAGRDHLDRPALPQPFAQQLDAAAHLRAAHQARREPEAGAGPRHLVEGDRRPHLGIQAAQEREVPRRLALHRRGRGVHAEPRAQRAQQPLVVRDVHQADRGREGRRSAHHRLQDRHAARAAAERPRLGANRLQAARREGHHRRTTTPARPPSAPAPTSSASTCRTSTWSSRPTTATGAARSRGTRSPSRSSPIRPRAWPRCCRATCR